MSIKCYSYFALKKFMKEILPTVLQTLCQRFKFFLMSKIKLRLSFFFKSLPYNLRHYR